MTPKRIIVFAATTLCVLGGADRASASRSHDCYWLNRKDCFLKDGVNLRALYEEFKAYRPGAKPPSPTSPGLTH